MTNLRKLLHHAPLLLLFVGLQALTVRAHAQAYGTGPYASGLCYLATVDSVNDVEQTACIQVDIYGNYNASSEIDDWSYGDFTNWPNGDPYVLGLGTEVQAYYNGSEWGDSGMLDDPGAPFTSTVQAGDALPTEWAYEPPAPEWDDPGFLTQVSTCPSTALFAQALWNEWYDPSGDYGLYEGGWTSASYGPYVTVVGWSCMG